MPVIAYLMIPDEQLIQELLRMQKEDFSLYQELVHDVRIKRKIIYTQEETVFTISVSNPQLQTDLYDDTGLSLLSNSYSSKIIRYLWIFLENAKEHLSRYMNNENFLSLLYRCHHGYTDLYMPYLDYESFLLFLNYSYRIKEDTDVVWLLRNANEDVITHFLEEGKISKEDMLSLLEHGSATVISTLLRFDMRISSLDYLSCKEWSDLLKKGVTIPVRLLEEPRILKKLTRMNSVKSYRLLIELLRKNHDVQRIEEKRKQYYDQVLHSYLPEEGMLAYDAHLYRTLVQQYDDASEEELRDFLEQSYCAFGDETDFRDLYEYCKTYLKRGDFDSLYRFLKRESQMRMTNMLIDYHFEEIPYNLFVDLKQLISFEKKNPKRVLTEEDISLYQSLLTLDDVSYEQKISWHETLKSFPVREKYYDDFRKVKDSCYQMLQDAIITKEKLKPYRLEQKSLKYGVNIYELKDVPFYALIKGFCIPKNKILTPDSFQYPGDAGSYSVDGGRKLIAFDNPTECYVGVYETLPISQIIHLCPTDSYSDYVRDKTDYVSEYVNQLLQPEELLTMSHNYNELVIAQPSQNRQDDLNNRLTLPKLFALYCFDYVSSQDIESAKNLGIDIVVVDTLSYLDQMVGSVPTTKWDEHLFKTDEELLEEEFVYVRDFNHPDMILRRKWIKK